MTGGDVVVSESAKLARRLLRPLRSGVVDLLADLIRVDTVAVPPHGNETPAQCVLQDFFLGHGVRPELYATEPILRSVSEPKLSQRNYKGRKNLIARLTGTGSGRSLLLSGHMDTVPTDSDQWSSSPWQPKISNGRMRGLGTFDMKGGLVAQAAVLCALKAGGLRLNGDLIFESVIDEEWGGGGGTLAARLRGETADACVISEGTQLEIFRGTRGGIVIDLLVSAGSTEGYFSASRVVSPAIPLGRLLAWVDNWVERRSQLRPRGAYASFEDAAPVQVLAIEANRFDQNIPLSVPLVAKLRLYFQFLPYEDVPSILKKIEASLRRFEKQDPFFKHHSIEWRPLYEPALLGHELSIDHPWTRCLTESATASLSKNPNVTAAPYPCDAFIMQRLYNIPTLLFGPNGGGAHNPDEYVEIKSVFQTAEVLLTAALEWCGG